MNEYDNMALDSNYVPNEKQLVQDLTVSTKRVVSSNLGSYVVQKGDTLYSISRKFELRVEELKQKNNLVDNTISIGQRLVVK